MENLWQGLEKDLPDTLQNNHVYYITDKQTIKVVLNNEINDIDFSQGELMKWLNSEDTPWDTKILLMAISMMLFGWDKGIRTNG